MIFTVRFHGAYHGQWSVFSIIKFHDTYHGDDFYGVVVGELKLGPTKSGPLNLSWHQNDPINLFTMFNGLSDECGLGGTPNF